MDPLATALLALAGVAITAVGVIVGHVLTSRSQNRATTVQAEAAKKTAELELIDQLQEELGRYRAGADARATQMEARMTQLEQRNVEVTIERDTLRDYAHELRSHIYDKKDPPPPEWPPGVFR